MQYVCLCKVQVYTRVSESVYCVGLHLHALIHYCVAV